MVVPVVCLGRSGLGWAVCEEHSLEALACLSSGSAVCRRSPEVSCEEHSAEALA